MATIKEIAELNLETNTKIYRVTSTGIRSFYYLQVGKGFLSNYLYLVSGDSVNDAVDCIIGVYLNRSYSNFWTTSYDEAKEKYIEMSVEHLKSIKEIYSK